MTEILTTTSTPSPPDFDSTRTQRPPITKMQWRALVGAGVGQFIEFYDFALYGIVSVTLAHHFFPASSATAGLLMLFATYGISFFIRPVGGMFFGYLGDRHGRRVVLTASILLIGIATGAIGLLPTVEQWGMFATIALVFCRLLQGFSAGGESVGSPAFAFEHAPEDRRGFFITITIAATALPAVFASLFVMVLQSGLSEEDFMSWGWRIPFLVAVPLSILGMWIRARTEESPAYLKMVADTDEKKSQSSPLRESFTLNGRKIFQVIMIMGFTAMGFYFLSGYFIPYVQTAGNLSGVQALAINAVAMTLYTLALPMWGILGDRIGRRRMLIGGAVAVAVTIIPAFMLVTSGNVWLALLGQVIFVLTITSYGGGCYAFFIEVFDTRTRMTSAAFSYNVGYAIFGGTAPFIGTLLVDQSGVGVAPAFYILALAIMVLLTIWLTRVPETRGLHD
ncbi:transporter major facilitator family protein [Corynebacterium deserti GIMN1.010]|uniref:Transporter major facilitator family protein n=1 Tax=Corynebacterium deserti GIMN1.010 TaxID=931089 RepID=A0A0M4CI64_9CORY|nr:MFS transporter [Corynebacterium deserti]ALC05708.1 transporter major facilitator family protein [Corynebacterium deserti GIMN1.010]